MEKSNILLDECKSAITLLRILGLFPLHINSVKKFEFKYAIASLLHSCLCYAFSMFLVIKQIIRRVNIINEENCDFDCLTFSIGTLLVLVPTALIPVAFWFNAKRTILFWDECYNFQIRYESMVGKPIEISIKSFITIFVISSVCAVPVVTTLPAAFIANFNFVATATYYVAFSDYLAGVSYWLAACMFLKQTANHILQFTKESFKNSFPSKGNFLTCYKLCVTMQAVLKKFEKSMELFTLIYGFSSMVTMLVSLYGFISKLYTTKSKSTNITRASGHLILTTWAGLVIYIVNESSYQVVNTIIEFYQIFRNIDSKLSFSGFNELSRAFFITILSATVTYTVIMLQIRNDYLFWQKQASTVNTCLVSNRTN